MKKTSITRTRSMHERMSASRAQFKPGKDAPDPLRSILDARHETATGMRCMSSASIGRAVVAEANGQDPFPACRTLKCARLVDTSATALASGTMQSSKGPAMRRERTLGVALRYIPELPGHATPRSIETCTHVTETSIQSNQSPFDDL